MSFWDSFQGAVDSVATNAEQLFDKGVKIYTAKTKFDTAKANQKTARTVAELNAQAQVWQAKQATQNGGMYGTERSAPILDGPQPSPVVINKQTESGGFGVGTLLLIGVVMWGLSNA